MQHQINHLPSAKFLQGRLLFLTSWLWFLNSISNTASVLFSNPSRGQAHRHDKVPLAAGPAESALTQCSSLVPRITLGEHHLCSQRCVTCTVSQQECWEKKCELPAMLFDYFQRLFLDSFRSLLWATRQRKISKHIYLCSFQSTCWPWHESYCQHQCPHCIIFTGQFCWDALLLFVEWIGRKRHVRGARNKALKQATFQLFP